MTMKTDPRNTTHHEHNGPQCKESDEGVICREDACRHDHHVSRHVEVSCTPVKGKKDVFTCVHREL